MTAAGLTVADAARIMREAVKDKSYQEFPLGGLWAEFLRHASVATTDAYLHSDLEDLRAAIEAMEKVEA